MEEQVKELLAAQLKGIEKEYFLKYGDIIPNVHSRKIKEEYKQELYKEALVSGRKWQDIIPFDVSKW